jgi:subtilisin family serine protease
MNANSDDGRGTEASARPSSRRSAEAAAAASRGTRTTRATRRYMIAPTDASITAAVVAERLRDVGITEIVRTVEPRGAGMPLVTVVRTTRETAANLRRTGLPNVGGLLIERDYALEPATATMAARLGRRSSLATAIPPGAGITTTIQVQGENEQPVERAVVQLIGGQSTAEGITGRDGKVNLTLFGELPGRSVTVLVKPRAGYWGLCREHWDPQADGNVVVLRPLTQIQELPWGGQIMQFDQVPPDYRGAGTRIALIDTGVATSHRQLVGIKQGLDAAAGDERAWSQDSASHGTPCAGILVAAADKETGVRGYAPGVELHVCKLGLDAYCSDLVAVLDYCIDKDIDIACIGYGCARGSAIVEQRLAFGKGQGVAAIAAAGSDGGPVQFPACSSQVLAIGAIGRSGTFPDDSLESTESNPQSDLVLAAGSGLFVPNFSCTGMEIDLCAPGVAVISCQSPDGYAACSGTSVAAPHVAALAALVLAHRGEFQTRFARRDARRVERLFQVLKETAQPLGDPLRSGAGLPDAARALGIQPSVFASLRLAPLPASQLSEMRRAIGFAGLGDLELLTEPPRGPAAIGQALSQFAPSPGGPVAGAGSKAGTGVQMLREAMVRAGL